MSIQFKSISELRAMLDDKAISASELAQESIELAKKYSLDPCQMALSFCLSRPFMTSVIFGATNEIQLLNNIKSTNLKLEKQHLTEITKIHRKYPIPF